MFRDLTFSLNRSDGQIIFHLNLTIGPLLDLVQDPNRYDCGTKGLHSACSWSLARGCGDQLEAGAYFLQSTWISQQVPIVNSRNMGYYLDGYSFDSAEVVVFSIISVNVLGLNKYKNRRIYS